MHLTPLSLEVPPLDLPIVFDFGIIYRQFQTLADTRKRRGVRYPLAVLLTIAVMAKLAGYSAARAIADWRPCAQKCWPMPSTCRVHACHI